MSRKARFTPAGIALALATPFFLAACDTSIDVVENDHDHSHDHDHDHGHDHSHDHALTGRLVFTEEGSTQAHVYDLADEEVLTSVDLSFDSALYASPGFRYAVAVQRAQGEVRFIDSGYEYESHGSHAHFHTNEPELISYRLTGEMPTHYDYFQLQGAVFYDGAAGTSSKVDVISDFSISEESLLGTLGLSVNMHGAAEVRGDYLFATYRSDPASSSTLPDQVEVYQLQNGNYDQVELFAQPCNGLHGSAINSEYVAFGCSNGVLLVSGEDSFTAQLQANPTDMTGNIGSLWSHEATNYFIGRAGQSLWLLDPESEDGLIEINWASEADRSIQSVAFNHSGNRFAVMDDQGELTIVRLRDEGHENYPFQIQGRIQVLENGGATSMSASAVNHQAYVTDQANQRVIAVDLHDGVVLEELDLSFVPGSVVWLGFTEEESGHDH